MKLKKNVVILALIVTLMMLLSSISFAETTGTCTTSNLRVRKEANTESEVLAVLEENQSVQVIEEQADWYKIKADGEEGYVSKQYIAVKKESESQTTDTDAEKAKQTNQEQTVSDEKKNEETVETNKNENIVINATIDENTSLRAIPVIIGNEINKVATNEVYTVIANAGEWTYVVCGDKEGWVLKSTTHDTSVSQNVDAAQTASTEASSEITEETQNTSNEKKYDEAKKYYTCGTSVNVRAEASKNSESLDQIPVNEEVTVIGESGDWYIVKVNGKQGYIIKTLLSTKKTVTSRSSNSLDEQEKSENNEKEELVSETEAPASTASSAKGQQVVEYAKNFLGYRYVYGTAGPNTFDCSGFVQYVYKHFGYSLSRSSKTQASDGVAVSKSNLQPGDVLIFKNTSCTEIGHVGIYIGGGQFIHASNSRTGVITSSLSSSAYQKRYVGARRIIQ